MAIPLFQGLLGRWPLSKTFRLFTKAQTRNNFQRRRGRWLEIIWCDFGLRFQADTASLVHRVELESRAGVGGETGDATLRFRPEMFFLF